MSERLSFRAIALYGVMLFSAMPLYAQSEVVRPRTVAESRALLNARIDSLLPLYHSAATARDSARAARTDSLRAARVVPLDTVAVGPFLVVGTRGSVRATRPRFEEAWQRLEPRLGAGTAQPLQGAVFLVEYGARSPTLHDLENRPGHQRIWFPEWRGTEWHRRLAAAAAGRPITAALPEDVRRWLGGGTIDEQVGAAYAHRQLRLSTDPSAPQCLNGDTSACLALLGLNAQIPSTPQSRADMQLRIHLLNHALTHGGAGSIERLALDDPSTAAERIAAAAATDIHGLVSGWILHVRAAEPDVWAGLGASSVTTVFWTLLFIGLAARSTRWRIG